MLFLRNNRQKKKKKKIEQFSKMVHGWGVNRTFGSFLWLLVGIFFPVMVTGTYIEANSCHVYWKVTTLLSGWASMMLNTSCRNYFLCSKMYCWMFTHTFPCFISKFNYSERGRPPRSVNGLRIRKKREIDENWQARKTAIKNVLQKNLHKFWWPEVERNWEHWEHKVMWRFTNTPPNKTQ